MTTPDVLNIYAPGLTLLKTVTWEYESLSGLPHTEVLTNMKWSPNGGALALALDELTIVDLESFTLKHFFLGSFGGVRDVAWSPKVEDIICICGDGTLLRYSLSRQQRVWLTDWTVDRTPRTVAWSPNGQFLAVGRNQEKVSISNAESGERIRLLGSSARLIFFNDSRRLACLTTSTGANVTIQDVITGNTLQEFCALEEGNGGTLGHWGPISSLALSPDERLLATGGLDNVVTLWSVESGNPIRSFRHAHGWIEDLAFSPDSSFLAGTSKDNILRVWSAKRDWKQVVQLPDLSGGWHGGVAFHPSQNILATGGQNGHAVHFWKYDPYAWR